MSDILPGEPLSEEETRRIANTFRRDGYVHVPGVLTAGEVKVIKEKTDAFFDDPQLAERHVPDRADPKYIQTKRDSTGEAQPFILRNTIELDAIYRDMLVREPILSLAEAIVGADCVFCGQNVLRNLPGVAIDSWHVDGAAHFPVPDDVSRHQPDTPPPTLWITVQMALTDTESIAFGPTQYIPGSHLSGHNPNSQENPEFEGRGPESVF
jgi:ectoine hydroxylase-related dioxygenase (phytanoyl-CoA dioxygenase family)